MVVVAVAAAAAVEVVVAALGLKFWVHLGRYEMKMTMFMYADTKTVKELNTRVDAWDAAQSTASQLHQTLLKHAGDNAQESVTHTLLRLKLQCLSGQWETESISHGSVWSWSEGGLQLGRNLVELAMTCRRT